MVCENEYQLEYSVGQRTADRLFAQMGRAIAKMEGLDGRSQETIKAELVETSFIEMDLDSGYAFGFDLIVGEEVKYRAVIGTDIMYGNEYYSTAVERTVPESAEVYLDIATVSEDTERVNRKETITELSEWTKSLFPGKNIILNVTDL